MLTPRKIFPRCVNQRAELRRAARQTTTDSKESPAAGQTAVPCGSSLVTLLCKKARILEQAFTDTMLLTMLVCFLFFIKSFSMFFSKKYSSPQEKRNKYLNYGIGNTYIIVTLYFPSIFYVRPCL